jgi:phenylalanyl-tRNA synthetase beta chain
MGGASSEVTGATRDVVIESAIFDPVSIRRTAFRYALRSEASLRFEKGQEHRMARLGADRTAALIARWAGGRVAVGVVDTQPADPPLARVAFRPWRLGHLLGDAIPVDEQRALLARVEVATEAAAQGDAVPIIAGEPPVALTADELPAALVAVVPSHRRDLRIEADLAEEVARVRGYETLPGRLPDTTMPAYRPDPRRLRDDLRGLLAGAGLAEVVTHGLIGPEDHARLGFEPEDVSTIRAANPVTVDHSELRRSLLPEHLRVLVHNERQRLPDARIFELGVLHAWRAGDAVERDVLGLLLAGVDRPVNHDRPPQPLDLAAAKGILELLAGRLFGLRLAYRRAGPRPGVDHPGRTAEVLAIDPADGSEHPVGRVGEVHPRLLAAYEARSEHVLAAEIDLPALASLAPAGLRIGALEHRPGIERDIAVVVGQDRPAGDVETVIREHAGPALHDVRLFDRYHGAPLAAGEQSLAYRLRFELPAGASDDDGIEAAISSMVIGLEERLGARLRA